MFQGNPFKPPIIFAKPSFCHTHNIPKERKRYNRSRMVLGMCIFFLDLRDLLYQLKKENEFKLKIDFIASTSLPGLGNRDRSIAIGDDSKYFSGIVIELAILSKMCYRIRYCNNRSIPDTFCRLLK